MTQPADDRTLIERYCRGFPEQNADGVDLSLIRANLKLTPGERLRRNYEYRQRILRLQSRVRRTTWEMGEMQVQTIGLEDLIRVKEHIARKKDSESLYQLRAIKQVREEQDRDRASNG